MSPLTKENRKATLFVTGTMIIAAVGGAIASRTLIGSNAAQTAADKYGALQQYAKGTKRTQTPFLGPFQLGKCGPEVRLMEGALRRAGFRKDVARNCFGAATKRQVVRFQTSIHYKPTGIYTRVTHQALVAHHGYNAQARSDLYYIISVRRLATIRKTVLIVAAHAYNIGHCCLTYSQSQSRQNLPAWPRIPPATDCSGFATWIAYQSGYGPAVGYFGPNGVVGWTGTLSILGHVVPPNGPLKIGDFVFYGNGAPWGHVAVYIGHGLVISHGGPGINELPWNYLFGYRSLQVRRYL